MKGDERGVGRSLFVAGRQAAMRSDGYRAGQQSDWHQCDELLERSWPGPVIGPDLMVEVRWQDARAVRKMVSLDCDRGGVRNVPKSVNQVGSEHSQTRQGDPRRQAVA